MTTINDARGRIHMGGVPQLFKALITRLKSTLFAGDSDKFLDKQMDELEMRMDSAERILLKERDNLLKELSKESDPIRKRRLILGITEIETILKKRRMFEES
ncbi:MAG: hypothetical protein ACYC56_12055 [Candidatus Aquicultor sp.]